MSDVFQKQIFLKNFEALIDAFPQLKVKTKIDRIFWFVRDLPEKGMVEIFNIVLDTFRATPTPSDFNDAAKAWRKRNNYFSNVEISDPEEIKICQYCRNSGVVRIVHLSNSEIDHLMRCNCFESWRSEHMKFPQFDYALKQVYKIGPCPLEWFKPNDKNLNGKEFEKLQLKYFSKIKNAEKYWADLGFKN